MLYVYLADLIVTIHLAFVGFVLVGQLAILIGAAARQAWARNFWFRFLHLLAIGIVVFETMMSYECPLTAWERDLLIAAGQQPSDRTFVGRLMHGILIYDVPTEAFAPAYYTFGAIVLLSFLLAPPRWPQRKSVRTSIMQCSSAPISPTRLAAEDSAVSVGHGHKSVELAGKGR